MANTTTVGKFYPDLRLSYAERFAHTNKRIRRADLMAAFGISPAQATADIQELQTVHPGCLAYDLAGKTYRWMGGNTLVTQIPFPVQTLSIHEPADQTLDGG